MNTNKQQVWSEIKKHPDFNPTGAALKGAVVGIIVVTLIYFFG